jgi:predicted secreted hydrolase
VLLEDWSVEASGPGQYHLVAKREGISLDLQLANRKGPVLQGDQGFSRKGPEPGNASNYYSLTRLETQGTVESGGNRYEVSGLSWMDHEWSTSALSSGQVGWDWFSIQLDDGSELMLYQIRRSDGSIDPFSSGVYIAPAGTTTPIKRDDFTIVVEDRWRSPHSRAVYPARWRLQIPKQDLELQITPLLTDQELNVSYSYWEGAVSIRGKHNSQEVSGNGYVELTGYSRSMSGDF